MFIRRRRASWLGLTLAVLFGYSAAQPSNAQGTDAERLQQCHRDLCAIIKAPTPQTGRPLQCDLAVTWYKETIERAARSRRLAWPFGDARCTLKLDVERAILARAITDRSNTLKLPPQAANCEVNFRGTLYPMTVTMAPEIVFRNGRAVSVALGVQKIDSNPVLKGVIWSAAKLEQNFGLLQRDFVSGVNRYIERTCRGRAGARRQVEVKGDSVVQ